MSQLEARINQGSSNIMCLEIDGYIDEENDIASNLQADTLSQQIDQLQKKLSLIFGLQKRAVSLNSGSLDESISVIKLFKNSNYTGNNVQRFYNIVKRLLYGWESSSHDDDQMSYFKISVISSEIKLFFRSIISLNGSSYVFRQLPELLLNTNSPAKFLGYIFDDILKSLNPLIGHGDTNNTKEYEVQKSYKILECLVLLSSAITSAISNNPLESAELRHNHRRIDVMMKRMLSLESMSDEAKLLSALLGENISPLIELYENSDVILRKLRAMVFTDSTIKTYISERENELSKYILIGSWQVSTVIDKAFWSSARILTKNKIDLQYRINKNDLWSSIYYRLISTSTNYVNLSSNPSLMLLLEFLFSILYLFLVVYSAFQNNGSIIDDYLKLSLSIMVLGVCLRELGELYFGYIQIYRFHSNTSAFVILFRAACTYFRDFWNLFDMMGLLSLLCWSILKYMYKPPYSPEAEDILFLTLKLSAIPITIGLLRFFVVLKNIGQFIIITFSMTYDLRMFGLIYLVYLLGFGIPLKSIFYDYEEFNSLFKLFISMFQMSLNNFPYDTFHDYDEYQYVGQAIIVMMVLSVTIALVNAIIAKFAITFRGINDNVLGVWSINKARYVTRYLNNKIPALMLPPPLNIVIFAIFSIMRVIIWICNVIVFMMPDIQYHNWWYSHADCFTDFSIGVCSSLSSFGVSIILLPVCAVVETFIAMSFFSPLGIISTVAKIPLMKFSIKLDFPPTYCKQYIYDYYLFRNVWLSLLSLQWFLYTLFRVIFLAILLISVSFTAVVALPLLALWFFVFLLHDILLTLIDNLKFLYYQFIISSYFLTKERRDIWDIQAPKVFEEIKTTIVSRNILYIPCNNSMSRIEWFYNNFIPERSLRYIYEENEYGLGEEFLWKMIGYLRMGVDEISKKEEKNIYDNFIPTFTQGSIENDMLLTLKDFKQIFDEVILDDDERIISYFKFYLERAHKLNLDGVLEVKKLNEEFLKSLKTSELLKSLPESHSEKQIDKSIDYYESEKALEINDTDVRNKSDIYISYFNIVMKATKIDEGTYVSKFSIGNN